MRLHKPPEPAQRPHQPRPSDRKSSYARGYTKRWGKIRLAYIEAHPICEVTGCDQESKQVDHVLPMTEGGEHGWGNLQALCAMHHGRKTAYEKMDIRAEVIAICGPPGAGKTTYVRERIGRGEMMIDLDAMAAALSGYPPRSEEARDLFTIADVAGRAALDHLFWSDHIPRAWIIQGAAWATQRLYLEQAYSAKIFVLLASKDLLRYRLKDDPPRLKRAIDWLDRYEPRPGEQIVEVA